MPLYGFSFWHSFSFCVDFSDYIFQSFILKRRRYFKNKITYFLFSKSFNNFNFFFLKELFYKITVRYKLNMQELGKCSNTYLFFALLYSKSFIMTILKKIIFISGTKKCHYFYWHNLLRNSTKYSIYIVWDLSVFLRKMWKEYTFIVHSLNICIRLLLLNFLLEIWNLKQLTSKWCTITLVLKEFGLKLGF